MPLIPAPWTCPEAKRINKRLRQLHLMPPTSLKTFDYFRCSFCLYGHTMEYSSEWTGYEEESRAFRLKLMQTLGSLVRSTKFEKYICELFTGVLSNGQCILLEKCLLCKKFINTQSQDHMCMSIGDLCWGMDYLFMMTQIRMIICNKSSTVIYKHSDIEVIPSLEQITYIFGRGAV